MKLISIILDFLFPKNITCLICKRPIDPNNTYSLCKECFEELSFIKEECYKCGKPIINKIEIDEKCGFCENKKFYFDRSISCIEYSEKSKILVLSLKYYGNTYLSRYIAEIMKEKIDFECIKADYIIPVPLHKKRMRSRGFNQAEKISKYLSILTEIPMFDCINRNRNTKKLYSLKKVDREKELRNAFNIKNGSEKIKDKTVFLIDDIFTTGTTVNEISKKLKLYGVKNIIVITLLTRNIN